MTKFERKALRLLEQIRDIQAREINRTRSVPLVSEVQKYYKRLGEASALVAEGLNVTGSFSIIESPDLREMILNHFGNCQYDESTRLITVVGTHDQFKAFNLGIEWNRS